jgi:hypothetical protein|tara:strand:- start:1208 stop:1357 length:150 start_codon:yes stop_codon:yes gene_type:complete
MPDVTGGVHVVNTWDILVLVALGYLLVLTKRWVDAYMMRGTPKHAAKRD